MRSCMVLLGLAILHCMIVLRMKKRLGWWSGWGRSLGLRVRDAIVAERRHGC